MRRPLLQCLIALALLLQGVGGAWAASRMAAGEVQAAAHIASLPPCHQAAAKGKPGQMTMRCCGTGNCHCVLSCGGLPALALASVAALFPRQLETLIERPQAALQAGHYGPPLRPPATLQS